MWRRTRGSICIPDLTAASSSSTSGLVTRRRRDRLIPEAPMADRMTRTAIQRSARRPAMPGTLASITDPSGAAFHFEYDGAGLLTQTTDRRGGLHKFTYDADGLLIKDQGPDGGSISLVRSGSGSDYTVTKTTAEGRHEMFAVQLPGQTTEQRTHVGSDGLSDGIVYGGSTSTLTTRDGSAVTRAQGPDARFGMLAPQTSSSMLTMGSHMLNLQHSQSVVLADPQNPFSLVSITDRLTRNGAIWTSNYSAAGGTIITTSPAGRTRTSQLDSKGRVTSIAVPA